MNEGRKEEMTDKLKWRNQFGQKTWNNDELEWVKKYEKWMNPWIHGNNKKKQKKGHNKEMNEWIKGCWTAEHPGLDWTTMIAIKNQRLIERMRKKGRKKKQKTWNLGLKIEWVDERIAMPVNFIASTKGFTNKQYWNKNKKHQ